jgi:multiple antibiotic resistance protein
MNSVLYAAYHNFTYTFITLFSILNPPGLSAVFLSMTQDYPTQQRHRMAWRVALYAAVLLIVVFFLGIHILRFFGISLASLQIAGGLLIFVAAWNMLSAPTTPTEHNPAHQLDLTQSDITFFPLTMPITAGAGAMAITIALAAHLSQPDQKHYVISHISAVLGICAVCVVVGICYSLADRIFKKLGETGTQVLTRLTAFILLAIAVTIVWNGIETLMLTFHSAARIVK